jgi:hypothetical protein
MHIQTPNQYIDTLVYTDFSSNIYQKYLLKEIYEDIRIFDIPEEAPALQISDSDQSFYIQIPPGIIDPNQQIQTYIHTNITNQEEIQQII